MFTWCGCSPGPTDQDTQPREDDAVSDTLALPSQGSDAWPRPGLVRLVLVSDTHDRHADLGPLPPGDILLHCGDLTKRGRPAELLATDTWLAGLRQYKHKLGLKRYFLIMSQQDCQTYLVLWLQGGDPG